jgi:peptidylprolyl isomerase/FKBP-type peptidyl-prolyl cis-trans isomerase FklB
MRLSTLAVVALALAAPLAACHRGTDPKVAAANLAQGEAFLAKNKADPAVVTLPDGVQYKVVTSGPATGASPRPADEVKVHYEGKLLDGTVFDSSFERGVPATFTLNGLIPAWVEVMQQMHPGDEWMIWVPASQGYGDEAKGPIPANSVLQFRIRLIDFLPASPATARG